MQLTKFYRLFFTAAVLLFQGSFVSAASAAGLLEFFGFKSPTVTPTPAPTEIVEDLESKTEPEAGSDDRWAGWDDPWTGVDPELMDPALVETDEMDDVASKDGTDPVDDDWKNDPYAYSFSNERYDEFGQVVQPDADPFGVQEDEAGTESKLPPAFPPSFPPAYGPGPADIGEPKPNFPTPTPTPRPSIGPGQVNPRPNHGITWYPIDRPPVFHHMCELPRTGLTGREVMSVKENVQYSRTSMTLTIPALNLSEEIVLVPRVEDDFPVSGLGYNIGLLEGSGPTTEDLFVLAGHNHLNAEEQGPFNGIGKLKESDLIFIQGAKGASRTFVVYANEKIPAEDIEGLLSYTKPGAMVLITCEDESIEGGYFNRRVIYAEAKEN